MAVIVPCFNSGPLILATIESLQEPEPLELIVVDDRSDDAETRQALAELEARGVRVIRGLENRGAAAARTTGLHATTAPFVFPLDADDLAIPGRISAVIAYSLVYTSRYGSNRSGTVRMIAWVPNSS